MKHTCPVCGMNTIPTLRVLFLTTLRHGVRCSHCQSVISRPAWLFVALPLPVFVWLAWIKIVDPPEHLGWYGLEAAALWMFMILVVGPLKAIKDRTPPTG